MYFLKIRIALALVIAAGTSLTAKASFKDAEQILTDKISSFVTVEYVDQVIRASYHLSKPVKVFEFQASINPYIAKSWQINSENLIITKDRIQAIDNNEFDEFSITIRPEPEDTENSWSLVQIGVDGVVLQTGYLLGNPDIFDNIICILDKPGVCDDVPEVRPAFDNKMSGVIDQMTSFLGAAVYFGTQNYEDHYDYRFMFDETTPEWLTKVLREELAYSLKFHQEELYWSFDTPITIFTHFDALHTKNQWRSDSTDDGAFVFRFRGGDFFEDTDFVRQSVSRYIYQSQNYRIANGWFRQKDAEENRWFYIGVLNYWTDSMMKTRFQFADRKTNREFVKNMYACSMNKAQIAEAKKVEEKLPFVTQECGYVFMWLADALIKSKSENRYDMFTVWQSLLGVNLREGGLRKRFLRQILDIDEDGALLRFFYSLNKPTLEYANALRLALISVGHQDMAQRHFPEITETSPADVILRILDRAIQ